MSDSTECKACFGQGLVEEGDPETGGDMVPCDNCFPEFVDVSELQRIAHELRTYNPAADPHKGAHIHKVWAQEIEKTIAGQRKAKTRDTVIVECLTDESGSEWFVSFNVGRATYRSRPVRFEATAEAMAEKLRAALRPHNCAKCHIQANDQ